MNAVTRIPPSPTGRLHIGTARTALFNYLFARHEGGTVVYRSEDTDKARSTSEHEQEIIDGLHWLGIGWDSFSRQSERTERYQEVLKKMVADDVAYISKEPSREDPSREVELIRLRNPGREVVFTDIIRGDINTHTGDLGDFVIARSISDPLYHLAVVVDDMDSGITHVIRGEDHISNTARQILIQEAISAPRPLYAHLPLILDEKRAKLSKRSGATSVMDYKNEGFLPEALVNYFALLGWNPGTEKEDFSLEELVKEFTLEGIQKSGAAFDRTKLLSVNQRWMRKLSEPDYIAGLEAAGLDPDTVLKAVPIMKERAHTFTEARQLLSGELQCLFSSPKLDRAQLIIKESPEKLSSTSVYLAHLVELMSSLEEHASSDIIRERLMPYAEQEGRGAVLWPLRYALSGQEKSPDPFTLISILGKDESLKRIKAAIAILEE